MTMNATVTADFAPVVAREACQLSENTGRDNPLAVFRDSNAT
jgi:hypothetical protein